MEDKTVRIINRIKKTRGNKMLNTKFAKTVGEITQAAHTAEGIKIQYKDPVSCDARQFCLSNGNTDLNDLDEFLEAVIKTYRIGTLTGPELELLQCLIYGLCMQHLQSVGCKTCVTITEDIALAYQDTLKISMWMRQLFSQSHQNQAIFSFDVNDKAEVRLVYRWESATSIPGIFSYAGIVIAQDQFDYDSFVQFCSATKSPLSSMDIDTAQSMHHLLCQNIRFLLNIGEGERSPDFKFNEREGHHVGSI